MIKNKKYLQLVINKLLFFMLIMFTVFTTRIKAQGVDVIFWIDNSGSIITSEWNSISNSTKSLIDEVLGCNTNNRVAIVHYAANSGFPSSSKIFIETNFTNNATTAKNFVRRGGNSGTHALQMGTYDFADIALGLIGNALDGNANANIISTQTTLTRNPNNRLVVFLFTDALRSLDGGSRLVPSTGMNPFAVYNQFKIDRNSTFVVLHAPSEGGASADIFAHGAAAAIASVGGNYNGAIDPNAGDPQGNGTKPRKAVMSNTFDISTLNIETIADNICRSCAPTVVINAVTPPVQNVCFNSTALPLVADAVGTGTLSYQWYSNTTNSTTGGTLISGATSSSYNPPTSSAGTKYYYVVVSDSYCEGKSTSAVVSVNVNSVGSGSAAPTVQNLSYSCPNSFVNLNTAHIGTIPTGASLVWFNNNTHTGSALNGTEITQAIAGTYYAFYYNNTGGCYSSPAQVVVNNLTPIDSDGDGVPDNCDLDDDNDGILDAEESPICFYNVYEANKIQSVISSFNGKTGFPLAGQDIEVLRNEEDEANGSTAFQFSSEQTISSNDAIFTVQYPTEIVLSSLSIIKSTSGITTASAFGKLFGSKDGVSYDLLTSGNGVSLTTSGDIIFNNSNITAYRYYQIRYIGSVNTGNTISRTINTAPYIRELTSVVSTAIYYNPSAHPKPCACSTDFDGDGIPNHLDWDSDGDQCPDSFEGGVVNNKSINSIVGPYGINGLANSLETSAESGKVNYISTYYKYGLNSKQILCLDTDNDSVPDPIDIDDDNDGVLDTTEGEFVES